MAVVRKVDSTIHLIVIFSSAAERHKKAMITGILNLHEIKSYFNSKILNFNMGLKNHYPLDSLS